MEIKKEHFEHNGEVDYGVNHGPWNDKHRVSLRKNKNGVYEIYEKHFMSRKEIVVYTNTKLSECVSYCNQTYGYNDTVTE